MQIVKKLQFLILFLLIISTGKVCVAQDSHSLFNAAMEHFRTKDFVLASQEFRTIMISENASGDVGAASNYFYAESLYLSGILTGAETAYLAIINNFRYSTFRQDVFLKLYKLYIGKNDLENALKTLVQYTEDYPFAKNIGEVFYDIADCYFKLGKIKESLDYYEKCSLTKENNKYFIDAIFLIGNCYEILHDYAKALSYYDKLLSYHKDNRYSPQAQLRFGYCCVKVKEFERAVIELAAPSINQLAIKQQIEAKNLLAFSFVNLGDYESASVQYSELLGKKIVGEEERLAKFMFAECKYKLGKSDEAFKLFEVLGQGSDSLAGSANCRKGQIKLEAGKENEAVKIFEDIIKKFSYAENVQEAKYYLGMINYRNKKYDVAENNLQSSAVSGNPELRAKSYILLGESALKQKKYVNADRNFGYALNLESIAKETSKRAILGAGISSFFRGKYDDSMQKLLVLDSIDEKYEPTKTSFFLAESYFYKGNFSKALNYYLRCDENVPEFQLSIIYGKAYSYFNTGDFVNSRFACEDFIKKYPDDIKINDIRLRTADSYFNEGDFQKANILYGELLESKSFTQNRDYAVYKNAQTLFKLGKTDKALVELSRFNNDLSYSAYAPHAKYFGAWIALNSSDNKLALKLLNELKTEYSGSSLMPFILVSQGNAFLNIKTFDSAVVCFSNVIKNFPSAPNIIDALNGLQDSYLAKDEPSKAIKVLDDFINKNSKLDYLDNLIFRKAEIYFEHEDYKNALAACNKITSTFPNSLLMPQVFFQIALCSEKTNKAKSAIDSYKKVIETYPNSPEGLKSVYEICRIYKKSGIIDSAVKFISYAISLLKDSDDLAKLLFTKATLLKDINDTGTAYDTYGEIVKYFDGTGIADSSRFERGKIELAAKRYDKAIEQFGVVAGRRNDQFGAESQFNVGNILLIQKKYREALPAFSRITSIYADFKYWCAFSIMKSAEIYIKLKDIKQAKELYKTIISDYKSSEFVKEANESLKRLGI